MIRDHTCPSTSGNVQAAADNYNMYDLFLIIYIKLYSN